MDIRYSSYSDIHGGRQGFFDGDWKSRRKLTDAAIQLGPVESCDLVADGGTIV